MKKEILFKEITVFSKRLGEDIKLEAFEAESGELIISTKSLEKFFSFEFCLKHNIKTIKEVEKLTVSDTGEPVYCLCKFTLSDSHGYREDSFGESLPSTRTNEIAKNNPFKIAELRAMSAGYIKYLELPGKAYSDSERPLEQVEVSKENVKEILKKEGENAKPSKEPSKEESVKPVEKTVEEEKTSNLGLQSAPVESSGKIEEVAPEDDIPSEAVTEESEKSVEESTRESEKEEGDAENNTEESNSFAPTEEELKLKVFFGPAKGRDLTVQDVLDNPEFSTFISNIPKVPKPQDKGRQDVIRAFLKALGCYTEEWEQQ